MAHSRPGQVQRRSAVGLGKLREFISTCQFEMELILLITGDIFFRGLKQMEAWGQLVSQKPSCNRWVAASLFFEGGEEGRPFKVNQQKKKVAFLSMATGHLRKGIHSSVASFGVPGE